MGYQEYGIERELIDRVKRKLKEPEIKERVKLMMVDITKKDLQSRRRVEQLLEQGIKTLDMPLSPNEARGVVDFVLAQKIDPGNTFHLIKLWAMLR